MFGADTRAAIRRFQHEIGADMTGVITPDAGGAAAGRHALTTAWVGQRRAGERGMGLTGQVQSGHAGGVPDRARPRRGAVLRRGAGQRAARSAAGGGDHERPGQAPSATIPTTKSRRCWPTSSNCASCRRPSRSGRRRPISARCSSSFPITASASRRRTRPTRRTARPTGRPTSSTCSAATRR